MVPSVRRRAAFLALNLLASLVLLTGLPEPAHCETRSLSNDYLLNNWDSDPNLSGSTVTSIVQTRDGYLWVGTYDGLIRFDGVRSEMFDSQNRPALGHSRIQGLYLDGQGGLWINTYRGGLTLYRNGQFTRELPDDPGFDLHTTMASTSSNEVAFVAQFGQIYTHSLVGTNAAWTTLNPPANSRPLFQCIDRDGIPWFLTRQGQIMRLENGQLKDLPANTGLDGKRALTLVADSHGTVWAGAQNQIARWDGQHFEDMTPTNLERALPFDPTMIFATSKGTLWILSNGHLWQQTGRQLVNEVTQWRGLLGPASNRSMGMHEDRDGGVWFNHYGNGVFHITPDGQFQQFGVQNGLPGDRVGAWFQDADGDIWLGVDRGGLVQLSRRHFKMLSQEQGLPTWPVLSVSQDPKGTVWIGTAGLGLYAWNNGLFTNYAVGSPVAANFVFSVIPDGHDGLWLSAGDGEDLSQFKDGQIKRSPWGVHGVKSLLLDREGRLWAGTKGNVGWYSPYGQRTFGSTNGVGVSSVRTLAEAPDGSIWAGADNGSIYRCQTNGVQVFVPQDAPGAYSIWSLLVDESGTVWAGTSHGGLLRFKKGRFTHLTMKQGLPMDITQILDDKRGRLWLGTRQGICCIEKSALNDLADGKAETVDVVRYLDGLPKLECSDGYQPACWCANDGRLWFCTVKGPVSVDPDELAVHSQPPPVVVEEMLVDGESMPLNNGKVVIPPGHEQYQFRFTAPSFNSPDQSRFRYRIENLDKHWVTADTRRQAAYGHLAPGDYRFRVVACNSDGVWSKTGASVDFTVLPYFYEARWFQLMMTVIILGGVAIGVRAVATRKYRRALLRLEQQHALEKDRARIAKNIHDHMGAGLTQITLLSELGHREPEHANNQFERISEAARDLTRAMDETVWAVDPERDTLASLMDYASAYAEDFLRAAGIRCRMEFPTSLPHMQIDAELRYNLFLALKEALNNVVKHAQATEVWLRLRLHENILTLIVEDNGQGFATETGARTADSARLHSGLGLANLRNRLHSIHGEFNVQSSPGKGTRMEMTVDIRGTDGTNGTLAPAIMDRLHEASGK